MKESTYGELRVASAGAGQLVAVAAAVVDASLVALDTWVAVDVAALESDGGIALLLARGSRQSRLERESSGGERRVSTYEELWVASALAGLLVAVAAAIVDARLVAHDAGLAGDLAALGGDWCALTLLLLERYC